MAEVAEVDMSGPSFGQRRTAADNDIRAQGHLAVLKAADEGLWKGAGAARLAPTLRCRGCNVGGDSG